MRCLANIITISLVLLSTSAWAEEAEEAESRDTTYVDRLQEGHRLYANNQHEAALTAYQAALDARSGDGYATYFVATTQRAAGNLDEALATFQLALERSNEDDALHARVLMNIAFLQEQRREFEAAREAWRAYIEFAEAHQDVATYVSNARQRLDAINAEVELDAAYEPVRQRIAERAASASDADE